MITKTDAVVLKSMKFRGTSKIVTFYTRRYGKLKGVAKGARETKSKFGAALEPLTVVSMVLYRKEHRDLQLISQCDILQRFKNISADIERLPVALSVIELLNKLTHEEEENTLLYEFVLETLDAIDQAEGQVLNILFAFELRICSMFGFGMGLDRCTSCGRDLDGLAGSHVVLQLPRGAVHCPSCSAGVPVFDPERLLALRKSHERGSEAAGRAGTIRLSMPALHLLRRFSKAKPADLSKVVVPEGLGNELEVTLRLYLHYHFEEFKSIRSLNMFHHVPQYS